MDQSVKQLFLHTISPNGTIRNNAETQLKNMEKNTEFLNYVRNVLMRDSDKSIQQICSIYFMNAMERNWSAPELQGMISELRNQILDMLLIEEKYQRLAYLKILQCIFDNSEKELIVQIFRNAGGYLSSQDLKKSRVALVLFEEVFRSEGLRFNMDGIYEVMFDEFGGILASRFTEYVAHREFGHAGICMKIIAKTYAGHSYPDFLKRIDVFTGYFQLATQILGLAPENEEGFLKMQKWAVFFLYKIANKGIRRYFKNNEFVHFVRDENTLHTLYKIFMKVLRDFINGSPMQDRVPIICADFFALFASSKRTKGHVINDGISLITSFILPAQCFTGKIQDNFEDDPEAYLREKHHYSSNDLHTTTRELFEEIIACDRDLETTILTSLREFLDIPVTEANAPMRYGIIGLLAECQRQIAKHMKTADFHSFLSRYVYSDLHSPHAFLISQALYFLSLTESVPVADDVCEVVNRIFALTNSENDIISVEACLALNPFFYIDTLQPLFKPAIPSFFEKILFYTKKYFLESLSTLCDSIIDCFTEEIAGHAPIFVQTLCSSFMDNIESDKEDRFAAISGCLSTIDKLIMASDDKPQIVSTIYRYASIPIYYVFKQQKYDFYREAFDLMNSFLFTLKSVNEHMFEIFVLSLSGDREELLLYSLEICNYIDNFLTYGREQMITPKTLELIYDCIDIIIPTDTNNADLYEDDFVDGCKIIDSLMLNAGHAAVQLNQRLIPAIIHKIVTNFDFARTYEDLPVFALNSIMNCFIVSPDLTLSSLGTFTTVFFEELCIYKKKFCRVYDKKLFLAFVGTLFKVSPPIPMGYRGVSDMLEFIVTTLPEAIKKRNKLKDKEETDEESDYSSEVAEDHLFEDIYFETVLDKLDAYEFTRNTLARITPGTTGEKVVAEMSPAQISNIRSVLEAVNEPQK